MHLGTNLPAYTFQIIIYEYYSCFLEEGLEGVISIQMGIFCGKGAIRINTYHNLIRMMYHAQGRIAPSKQLQPVHRLIRYVLR
jgi:hypothetical protein